MKFGNAVATWFITGCSSGLGRSLAQAALEAGHDVVLTARDAEPLSELAHAYPRRALALPLDVTDARQIARAVSSALKTFDGIDVLVNNAGYGYRSAVEEGDEQDVAALFATNFFGPVALIKAVLPGMRAKRRGTIVNVSSSGVRTCPPGSGYYVASKAAVEAVSASLRKEVAPLGLNVIVVEPGAFRTDFTGRSLHQAATPIADYATTAGRRRKENDTAAHGTQPGDPVRAAHAVLKAVADPRPPALLLLGSDALNAMTDVINGRLDEMNAWRTTTLSTDYEEPVADAGR